jgi:glyoxylase-like metal-dependent hydrolase (beta-lactamase superfamily II)
MVMLKPDIHAVFDPETCTISYVAACPNTRACVIIDPVLDFCGHSGRTALTSTQKIVEIIDQHGLTPVLIVETHVHADHISAAPWLKEKYGAPIAIGDQIGQTQKAFAPVYALETELSGEGAEFDRLLADGEPFKIGELDARSIHTPGHTPACISVLIGDAAFVGDTLFMPDFGTARCDFPGGDARTLHRSIQVLFALPGQTRMFLCHDYKAPGRDAYTWETTVAEQRAHNVHVGGGVSEEAFVAMRTARDANLKAPKLILASVQANIRAGALPEPDAMGRRFFKLPLDAL